jgi:uncharacterized protein (TIGR03437 family)
VSDSRYPVQEENMRRLINREWHRALMMVVLCAASASLTGFAQALPPVILEIDLENYVDYCSDVADYSKLATIPSATTSITRTFGTGMIVADIVAVNGKPAKGTYFLTGQGLFLRTAPTPGQMIADTVRNGFGSEMFEILQADGTPVGSVMTIGATSGTAPPGSPSDLLGGNFAVIGGTGAYFGAQGQKGGKGGTVPQRTASAAEDPANRRLYGGGKMTFTLRIVPMFRPEIASTSGGPAIVHSSDFSLVTASNPAHAGEELSLFAKGLGPTSPSVDAGKLFPSAPLAVVNSPVEVTLNGTSAQVLGSVGYPGSLDGYQVNFRVPSGAPSGTASVVVSAAWIPSAPVSIPVQ